MIALYRRVLGERWRELPEPVRTLHDGVAEAAGEADVERGGHLLARLATLMMGFPPVAAATPVHVRFEADELGETWTRRFGDASFSSRQFAGVGRDAGLLCERFGVFEFAMALELSGDQMRLIHRRWRVLGVPLPQWLAPRWRAYESAENGVLRFFVEISHPLCGLIVRYKGWLKPQPPGPRV
jgi:hypothetical protein